MKRRKKGAIFIYALYIIIALLTLSAILMNLLQGTQTITRMHQAAEEGARVRAQAIDILLKEQAGIIEILHNSIGYEDNVDHPLHNDVSGHINPILPQSAQYQLKKQQSDSFAKEAIVTYVNNSIYKEVTGKNQLASVTTKDICFDFEALPDGSLYDDTFDPETADKSEINQKYKLDFSCTTANGDVIKADNVQVSGVKKNTVKIGEKGGKIQTIKSANVVFVGIKFNYTYFYSKLYEKFGFDGTNTGEVWAIAYPQADKCVRSDEACTY